MDQANIGSDSVRITYGGRSYSYSRKALRLVDSNQLRGAARSLIPAGHAAPLEQLAQIRRRLKAQLPDPALRRHRLERLLLAFRRTYFPSEEQPR